MRRREISTGGGRRPGGAYATLRQGFAPPSLAPAAKPPQGVARKPPSRAARAAKRAQCLPERVWARAQARTESGLVVALGFATPGFGPRGDEARL